MPASVVKTVKLPPRRAKVLARVARERGLTESELIREGIESVTGEDAGLDMAALLGPDVGAFRGPADLAQNKAHRAGYGRSRDR